MIGVFHFTPTKRLVKQSIWLYFQPSLEEFHVSKKKWCQKEKTVHWGVKGQPFLYDGDTNTTVVHIYKIFFRDQWFVCTPPIAFALSTKDVSYSLGSLKPSWNHSRYVSRFFVQGIFPSACVGLSHVALSGLHIRHSRDFKPWRLGWILQGELANGKTGWRFQRSWFSHRLRMTVLLWTWWFALRRRGFKPLGCVSKMVEHFPTAKWTKNGGANGISKSASTML